MIMNLLFRAKTEDDLSKVPRRTIPLENILFKTWSRFAGSNPKLIYYSKNCVVRDMAEYLLVISSNLWQNCPTLEVRFHSDACSVVDLEFRHSIIRVAQWILPSGSVDFFENVMTTFSRDAWKTDLNLFFCKNKTAEIINSWVWLLTMKSSQRARANFHSYWKTMIWFARVCNEMFFNWTLMIVSFSIVFSCLFLTKLFD